MLPTRTLFEYWGQLWGTTAPLQAIVDEQPAYRLLFGDFTPSLDLAIGDLDTGADDETTEPLIHTLPEEVDHGVDPLTSDKVIRFNIKYGDGFKPFWKTASGGVGETVYGYALCNLTNGALLGLYKFPTPIPITRTNQIIELPDQCFTLPTDMVR